MPAHHRPILPAPGPSGSRVEGGEGPPPKKRRGNAGAACNSCRAKKASCDRQRPCARCSDLGVTCEYAEPPTVVLQNQLDRLREDFRQHAEFLNRLRSAPEPEALSMMRRLQSANDISSVLSSIEGAAHTAARPSDLETARAILPRTESDIEFELHARYASVYPALPPLGFNTIGKGHLSPRSRQGVADEENSGGLIPTVGPPQPLRGTYPKHTSPVSGPVQDRHYCDSRLNRLSIKYWTTIPISDEFAASVLSHHFETYHAIFGCVDCDLFLSDLVNHELNYCSPLLVSAIMSFACQSYSTFDVRSSTFSVMFRQDAEKLWRAEQASDDPKNLAALCYLMMACNLSGEEKLRHEISAETRAMATRMSLIGTRPTDELTAGFHQLPEDKIRELAHVAWGVYGAQSYLGIYYLDPPIPFPPMLPVPGDAKTLIGSPKLVWPAHPLPAYMGCTFPKISSLWVIVQEINSIYVPTDRTPLAERVPLAFAELKCRKLLAWAEGLSSDLLWGAYSTSHILFFHGLYHCIMLSLFRPFRDSPEKLRLRSFSSSDATPSSVYSASLSQLKRLLVAYCMSSRQPPAMAWFNSVALEVANAMVQNSGNDPQCRFYLQACFEYWKKAYVRYRTFYPVTQAFLSVAIKSGVIGYDLAASMLHELRMAGLHYDASEAAISSAILDFDLALAGKESARVEALATQFDELVSLHEFTNLEEDQGSPVLKNFNHAAELRLVSC